MSTITCHATEPKRYNGGTLMLPQSLGNKRSFAGLRHTHTYIIYTHNQKARILGLHYELSRI